MGEYDKTYEAPVDRPDTRAFVRFDKEKGDLDRFVVQLQYNLSPPRTRPTDWRTVAQIDHAPQDSGGHNVYQEGIHVDVYRLFDSNVKVWPEHDPLPRSPGTLLRVCVDYFQTNYSWFFDVQHGQKDPVGAPGFDW